MDTIFHQKKRLFKLFGTRSLVFSIHMYKPKDYGIFYVIDLKKIVKLKLLKSYFDTLLDDDYVLSKRSYKGHEIFELYDKATKETLHISFIKNQLIASYVHTLVEASIDQYNEPFIGRDLNFIEVHKRAGYDDMFRLYVQYVYIDEYIRYFSDEKNDWAKLLSNILAFSGFNLDLKSNNTIVANGYTNLNIKGKGYLQALQKSGTARHEAAAVIPRRSAIYMSVGFDSFTQLYDNFEGLLERDSAQEYNVYQKNIEQIERLLKIDVKEHFISWIGNEIAFVEIQPENNAPENEMALLIKAKDIVLAQENLDIIAGQVRKHTPVKFKQINYRGHPINFLAIKDFFAVFFGGAFSKFEKPYFTIIEDYVIFSNDPGTLKTVIDNFADNTTLATSEDYEYFKSRFSKKSAIFTYLNMPALYKRIYALADTKTKEQIQKNEDFIICFPQLGFELMPEDNLFETKMIIDYQKPEVVRAKDQFAIDSFYGPGRQPKAEQRENMVTTGDAFQTGTIFPDDLNANEYVSTYKDGSLHIKVSLKDGQKHGRYLEYYENGAVKLKGRFKKDVQTGTWKYFDREGNLISKKMF